MVSAVLFDQAMVEWMLYNNHDDTAKPNWDNGVLERVEWWFDEEYKPTFWSEALQELSEIDWVIIRILLIIAAAFLGLNGFRIE